MNVCARLSDRMIEVVHRNAAWSAAEAEHLASCPDCALEWRLVQGGSVLGTELGTAIPSDFLATRVLAGLRSPPRRRWGWVRWSALPLAAAAVLGILVFRGGPAPEAPRAPAAVTVADVGVLPELEDLDETQLEAVLDLLPSAGGLGEVRSLEDLSDEEITRLLDNLEG